MEQLGIIFTVCTVSLDNISNIKRNAEVASTVEKFLGSACFGFLFVCLFVETVFLCEAFTVLELTL